MKKKTILGVKFHTGSVAEVVDVAMRGGLVVVPSAPVLVDMADQSDLCDAMLNADLAVPDSGLMVLLWWMLEYEKVERVSGLEYLIELLQRVRVMSRIPDSQLPVAKLGKTKSVRRAGRIFWVMPSAVARDRNLVWLRANGHSTTEDDCYIAPIYSTVGPLSDPALLDWIEESQPSHVILCLGGGVQERLGYFLKEELSKAGANDPQYPVKLPSIHCIGAAIGFLSGDQVRIPRWVDYLYLGWLWRSISAPQRFVPRYWKALRLAGLMLRHRDRVPLRSTGR